MTTEDPQTQEMRSRIDALADKCRLTMVLAEDFPRLGDYTYIHQDEDVSLRFGYERRKGFFLIIADANGKPRKRLQSQEDELESSLRRFRLLKGQKGEPILHPE